MKKIVIVIGILIVTVCVAPFLIKKNDLAPEATGSVLVVGTSDDYPPYTFSKDGKVVGFDIDLIQEVAQRMACTLELKVMSFDVLLLELQRGSIQVIAAGLTPTAERARKVFFSSPYVQGDPLLAVTYNNSTPPSTLGGLKNKTSIVNEGYTADFYLSTQPELHLEKRETVAECLLALKNGKADVYIVAKSAFQPFLKMEQAALFTAAPLADISEQYAFAISKKYPELFEKIESALTELREDGTIDNLKKKWEIA